MLLLFYSISDSNIFIYRLQIGGQLIHAFIGGGQSLRFLGLGQLSGGDLFGQERFQLCPASGVVGNRSCLRQRGLDFRFDGGFVGARKEATGGGRAERNNDRDERCGDGNDFLLHDSLSLGY